MILYVVFLALEHSIRVNVHAYSLTILSRMATEEAKKYPGFTGKAYPEIFTTVPPQPKQQKPGQLSEEQVKKFFEEV